MLTPIEAVIPGRCEASNTRNLEVPGLVLTHHPGMTLLDCFVASLLAMTPNTT